VISKRIVDFVLATLLLGLAAPLLLIVGVLVRVRLGSPVLFRQQRPGKGGRPFQMLKFRSMMSRVVYYRMQIVLRPSVDGFALAVWMSFRSSSTC
jgi:lipopolysaccharide/colanic/teichoic acid biosynthesis glycosyltransferase